MRAGTIITDGDQVLVMRRYRTDRGLYFALIGGGVEGNETVREAAIREAKEETDLDVRLSESFTITNDFDNEEHMYFVVREWTGVPHLGGPEAERNSEEDQYELVWMRIEHLREFAVKPEAAVERFLELIGDHS